MSDILEVPGGVPGEPQFGETLIEPTTSKELEGLAERALDLMAGGTDEETAVTLAGGSPKTLTNTALRAAIERLKAEGYVSAEVQRAFIRQRDFNTYVKTGEEGVRLLDDPKGDPELALALLKEARDLSKLIRTDPEIALTAPPVVIGTLEMKPIQKFIDSQASPAEVFNWDVAEAAEGDPKDAA